MSFREKYKYNILLHLVVLIFGFTAIIGKFITVGSTILVWYRMLIAFAVIGVYLLFTKSSLKLKKNGTIKTLLTGVIIATHWIFFFEAIKQSTASVALAALSSASLFTSLLEPIFFKRKVQLYEILLGLVVIAGLYFIYEVNPKNGIGILLGVIAAFLASTFTVINGKLIQTYDSQKISLYELFGGFLAISIYLLLSGFSNWQEFYLSTSDLMWLLVLAIICTAFAFVMSVEVMKELTPFTVSLTINLEPVYGIIMAFLIFGEEEKMSTGFYIGTLLILTTIFVNVYLKRKRKLRLEKTRLI